jgi:hypothetical protein
MESIMVLCSSIILVMSLSESVSLSENLTIPVAGFATGRVGGLEMGRLGGGMEDSLLKISTTIQQFDGNHNHPSY